MAATIPEFLHNVGRIGLPYVMTAVGGGLCMQAGLVNVFIEGLLLTAAFGAATLATLGPLAGGVGGVLWATGMVTLYLIATLLLRGDALISSLAIYALSDGLSRYLLVSQYGSHSSTAHVSTGAPGTALQFVLCGAAVALVWLVLRSTVIGFRLRAVGQEARLVASAGVSVRGLQSLALLGTGVLVALGGVFLFYEQQQFVPAMSAGRGFIGISIGMIGQGGILFSGIIAAGYALVETTAVYFQSNGSAPNWLVLILPYIATLIAVLHRSAHVPERH